MIIDVPYFARVLKNILYVIFLILGTVISLKLSIFYMPFLIAFILSLIVEPLIKTIMRKTNLTRRSSSIIIFIVVSTLIIGVLIWLILTLFTESQRLLIGLNGYIEKTYNIMQKLFNDISFDNLKGSKELLNLFQNSTNNYISTVSDWLKNLLSNIINFISSIPNIAICIGITVIALYFICVDKIYILDQIEHHIPKNWVKKIETHLKELIDSLGGYLKAQVTLVLISFFISLIGLYLLKVLKFNINYPLLMALFIGFVDALPILGSRKCYDTMGNFIGNKWRY